LAGYTSKIPKKFSDEHRYGHKYLNLRGLIFVVIAGVVSAVLWFLLSKIHYKIAIVASLYSFLIISAIGVIVLPEKFELIGYKVPLARIILIIIIHEFTKCIYVADLPRGEIND